MERFKFKAKSIKTGEWVEGDLAYVYRRDRMGRTISVKPWIVSHHGNGGMIYIGIRHLVDPDTIELIS